MSPVLIKTYPDLTVSVREVLRYAGCGPDRIPPLLEPCLREAEELEPGRVCYRVFPVRRREDGLDLGFAVTASETLRKYLEHCGGVLLFAATAGLGIDRLIGRYNTLSPARALLFQAIGAARVEELCDRFCADAAAELGKLRPRFSPGYGDVSLEIQRAVFQALDCQRKIGLTLNGSFLMSPSKSVTALVGIPGELAPEECAQQGSKKDESA